MNQRLMRAAEEQMRRAEDIRKRADQAVTPEMHRELIEQYNAAMAAGRVLVIDARDTDPEE